MTIYYFNKEIIASLSYFIIRQHITFPDGLCDILHEAIEFTEETPLGEHVAAGMFKTDSNALWDYLKALCYSLTHYPEIKRIDVDALYANIRAQLISAQPDVSEAERTKAVHDVK